MRTYLQKIYNYFCGLNMPEDNVESESFIFVTDNLQYSLQVYLADCAYKIANTQLIEYLDNNLSESDEN